MCTVQGAGVCRDELFSLQVTGCKGGRGCNILQIGAASAGQMCSWAKQIRGKKGTSFAERFTTSRCVTEHRVFLRKKRRLPV